MPDAYDARDVLAGQPRCRAFRALSQGNCGWCVPFATAAAFGARMCLQHGRNTSRTNTVFSAQQIGDCAIGACDAGVYMAGGSDFYASAGTVIREASCAPYVGNTTGSCSAAGCASSGAEYSAVPGSSRIVPASMFQAELLLNGPGVVSMELYSDFDNYGTGIYRNAPDASVTGRHTMSLVGWGTEGGVPYWLCQNSYGSGWGQDGYVRVLRGANVGGIESNGMSVVSPAAPATSCGCSPGSNARADCTCECLNLWSGPTCSDCPAVCFNGGVVDPEACACVCPPTFSGPRCEFGVSISQTATCDAQLTGAYALESAPAAGSVLFLCASNCGNAYEALRVVLCDGGACAASGNFTMAPPAPGTYTIGFVERVYDPVIGFYFPVATRFFGQVTVLAEGCSPSDLAWAAAALSAPVVPPPVPDYPLMQGRLAAAAETVAQMRAQGLPAVTGFSGDAGFVLRSYDNARLCYHLPSYANPPAKEVYLSNSALLATSAASDVDACVPLSFAGYATGVSYTVQLRDATNGGVVLLETKPFVILTLTFSYAGISRANGAIVLPIRWNWGTSGRADVADVVRVLRVSASGEETVFDWWYTHCACKDRDPSSATAASVTGSVTASIPIPVSPTGASYPAYIYPGRGGGARMPSTFRPSWASYGV